MKALLSVLIVLLIVLFVPLPCILWMVAGAVIVKILG